MSNHVGWRALSLLGAVALVYANALGGTFHYDDFHSLVNNPHVRDLANIPAFFLDPGLFSVDTDKAMYRPLLLVSYAINFALGGYVTSGYHLLNMVIHALCVLLVWRIGIRMGLAASGAYFSALLFALHPLAAEPVNYISSRSESLSAAFFLAAFYGYLGAEERVISVWSLLAAAAALLVKSIAFVLPFVLISYELLWRRRRPRAVRVAPYFSIAAAYLALISANRFLGASLQKAPRSLVEQVWTQIKALVYYIKMVIMPVGLNVEHAFSTATSGAQPVVIFALAILIAVGYCAYRARRRRSIFWLSWFLVGLGPTLVVPLNVLVNEHRLYMPLAAVALALGQHWPRLNRRALRVPLYLLLAIVALITVQRNRVWADEFILWSDAVNKAPEMPRAQVHLGNAQRDRARWNEARKSYMRALQLDPQLLAARTNLANLYYEGAQRDTLKAGEYLEKAAEEYQRVLQVNPIYGEALNNLGSVYLTLGRLEEAKAIFLRARIAHPHMVDVYFNLGLLEVRMGNYKAATEYFKQCIELKEDGTTYRELGHALAQAGDLQAAATAYRRATELDVGDMSSLQNLAEVLLVSGERDLAQQRRARALEQWREARALLQNILQRDPGNTRAQDRLRQLQERLP
jgi:tetratricopeptide (TPR) repeat protein